MILQFIYQPLVAKLGWVLLHFVWQGAAVAALAAVALGVFRTNPRTRYLICCGALLGCIACPITTFLVLPAPQIPKLILQSPAPIAVHPLIIPDIFASSFDEEDATPPQIVSAKPIDRLSALRVFLLQQKKTLYTRLAPWIPWGVLLWMAGVFLLSGKLLAEWLVLQRNKQDAIPLDAPIWLDRLEKLTQYMRVSRPVQIFQSAVATTPQVIGWLRPVILLPASVITGLSAAQIELILIHELAHILRNDYLINLLQAAAETLLFYHPAVWWISRRIREEREHCCDDLVVEFQPDRMAYARTLAELAVIHTTQGALSMSASGGSLLERIQRLIAPVSSAQQRKSRAMGIVLIAAAIVGISFGIYHKTYGGKPTEKGAVIPDDLTGIVVDSGDKPELRAEVTLNMEKRTYTRGSLRSATVGGGSAFTDRKGIFIMNRLPKDPGKFVLFATKSNQIGWLRFEDCKLLTPDSAKPANKIVLAPLNLLKGKLTDEQGNPMQNVAVSISAIRAKNFPEITFKEFYSSPKFWERFYTRTNAAGEFALSVPANARITLTASRDQYSDLSLPNIDTNQSDIGTSIMIKAKEEILGRAIDKATGKPIVKTQIMASRTPTPSHPLRDDRSYYATTDDLGNFRIPNMPTGNFDVCVYTPNPAYPDLVPGTSVEVNLKAGQPGHVTVFMVQGYLVTGRILEKNTDKPVTRPYALDYVPGPYYNVIHTAPDGTFTTYLAPGQYTLQIGYGSKVPSTTLTVEKDNPTALVTLYVPADDSVIMEGKYRARDGNTLDGVAPVSLWTSKGISNAGYQGNGSFRFVDIKRGLAARLIIDAPGYALWMSPPFVTGSNMPKINATLEPAPIVTVSGHMIDNITGKPLAGALMEYVKYGDAGIYWTGSLSNAGSKTDAEGRFSLPAFRPGDRFKLAVLHKVESQEGASLVTLKIVGRSEGFSSPLRTSYGWFSINFLSEGAITVKGTQPINLPEARTQRDNAQFSVSNLVSTPATFSLPPLGKDIPWDPSARGDIGLALTSFGKDVVIQWMLANSAAQNVGLLSGDIILQIDGKEVSDLSKATHLLNGDPGTKVHVLVKHLGGETPQSYEIIREKPDWTAILKLPTQPHMIDRKKLEKITLSKNSNREQIQNYIRDIFFVSMGQTQSSASDPQVNMLEQVGAENINLLLEASSAKNIFGLYTTTAIARLARDEDRDLILRHLKQKPELIRVITKKHWEEAARPILLEAAKEPSLSTLSWFNALAQLKEPSTYNALRYDYTQLPNKYFNFAVLMKLPGFDLKTAVAEAWEYQKSLPLYQTSENGLDNYEMAIIAARYGHRDALDYLFKTLSLKETPFLGPPLPSVKEAILSVIDTGGNPDLQEWYKKNKASLHYNEAVQKFTAATP
ncbi:MAG: M56 family metallopeptidase [Chthoniobacterales bacterium]